MAHKTRKKWWRFEDDKLRELYPTMSDAALAILLDRTEDSVFHRARKLGLRKAPEYTAQFFRHWTPDEEAELARDYPDTDTDALARRFGTSRDVIYRKAHLIGLHKSAEFQAAQHAANAEKLRRTGRVYRFPKGNRSWNTGLKGVDMGGRSHETRFKPGQKSVNWKPVGSLRTNSDGYLQRKVQDTGYPPADWKMLHVLLWEEHHGPVPPKHYVIFRDKDRTRVEIENLECISQAEHARRNRGHHYPPELKEAIRLRNKLRKTIEESA
jgi:hypothetical protein